MTTITFTLQPGAESIYFVHDRLSGQISIGRVAKVGKLWCAAPGREELDGPRKGFKSRREAAYALARFTDTGVRAWIFAA